MNVGQLVPAMEALGFAAGGLAAVLRVIAKHWLPPKYSKQAPIGCGLCMGWWSTIVISAGLGLFGLFPAVPLLYCPIIILGATGVAAWINVQIVPVPLDLPPDV